MFIDCRVVCMCHTGLLKFWGDILMQLRRDERQVKILAWLADGVGSARQAARQLNMPLQISLREFKALHRQGLIRYDRGPLLDKVWHLTQEGREMGR